MKRQVVISACYTAQIEEVNAELYERFQRHFSGDFTALDPSLYETAFKSVLTFSEQPEMDFVSVVSIIQSSTDEFEKLCAVKSLGCINDFSVAEEYFYYAALNEISPKYYLALFSSFASAKDQEASFRFAFDWFTTEFNEIFSRANPEEFHVDALSIACCSRELAEEIEAWSLGHHLEGNEVQDNLQWIQPCHRYFEAILETIKASADWHDAEINAIRLW